MAIARKILIAVCALLLAIGAVRAALVALPFAQRPIPASAMWSSHPALLIDRAMTLVGDSARLGRAVPPEARALLRKAAVRDPLAPEPFLVEGTFAQVERRDADAERLFRAAKARDPRGAAARYFLAEREVETGRYGEALREMAVLARIVPGAEAQFTPTLVAFAREPQAVPVLAQFFDRSPSFAPAVLSSLAQDPANADLVLALAGPRHAALPERGWETTIVSALVEAGEPAKAQAVWRRLAAVQSYQGIYNSRFLPTAAPAPFNWTYDNSGGGLATPHAGGGLDLIYYGRDNVDLAWQLVMLAPGTYELAAEASDADNAGAVGWRVECEPDKRLIAGGQTGGLLLTFTVPATECAAQRVALAGTPLNAQDRVQLTITAARITRRGAP